MTSLIRLSVFGIISFLVSCSLQLQAQIVDYTEPTEYEIGGIKVKGAVYSDEKAVVSISGLKVGDRIAIPGVETRKAIKSLYKLRLYDDVQLRIENTAGDLVFLEIMVKIFTILFFSFIIKSA